MMFSPMPRSMETALITFFGIFSFDAQLFVAVGTDGNVNSIIIFLDIFDPDILSNGDACMDIDTRPKDMTDVTVKDFRRQAVIRNAIAEHPA